MDEFLITNSILDVGVKYKSTVSWQGCLNAKTKPYPKMVSKFAKYQKNFWNCRICENLTWNISKNECLIVAYVQPWVGLVLNKNYYKVGQFKKFHITVC